MFVGTYGIQHVRQQVHSTRTSAGRTRALAVDLYGPVTSIHEHKRFMDLLQSHSVPHKPVNFDMLSEEWNKQLHIDRMHNNYSALHGMKDKQPWHLREHYNMLQQQLKRANVMHALNQDLDDTCPPLPGAAPPRPPPGPPRSRQYGTAAVAAAAAATPAVVAAATSAPGAAAAAALPSGSHPLAAQLQLQPAGSKRPTTDSPMQDSEEEEEEPVQQQHAGPGRRKGSKNTSYTCLRCKERMTGLLRKYRELTRTVYTFADEQTIKGLVGHDAKSDACTGKTTYDQEMRLIKDGKDLSADQRDAALYGIRKSNTVALASKLGLDQQVVPLLEKAGYLAQASEREVAKKKGKLGM